MDWASFVSLVVMGLLAAGVAWWLRSKVPVDSGTDPRGPGERLTSTWSLAELGRPLVVAREVDVEVPAGVRMVVSGTVTEQAYAAGQVRQVPEVPGDYAVDAQRGKVLLFAGGVRAQGLALASHDAGLVARLAAEGEALWQRARPYVESRRLAEAAARTGVPVAIQGLVSDVMPRQGAFLIRLEDQGQSLGVRVTADASELKGQRVLVQGVVQREGGYPVLVATDVRRLE